MSPQLVFPKCLKVLRPKRADEGERESPSIPFIPVDNEDQAHVRVVIGGVAHHFKFGDNFELEGATGGIPSNEASNFALSLGNRLNIQLFAAGSEERIDDVDIIYHLGEGDDRRTNVFRFVIPYSSWERFIRDKELNIEEEYTIVRC